MCGLDRGAKRPTFPRGRVRHAQRGVVIFLALIALVALTLGGLALFRSADIGGLVVGNMGMQRSATRAGDAGTNAAMVWLNANGVAGSAVLHSDSNANGYSAAGVNDVPGTSQTWAEYWATLTGSHPAKVLSEDTVTGNQVSYVIQRLCDKEGPAYSSSPLVRCVKPPYTDTASGGQSVDDPAFESPTSVYYRVTSRIAGPRNSVSFIQALVIK
jgi:type IV pilus assembly protein PilX